MLNQLLDELCCLVKVDNARDKVKHILELMQELLHCAKPKFVYNEVNIDKILFQKFGREMYEIFQDDKYIEYEYKYGYEDEYGQNEDLKNYRFSEIIIQFLILNKEIYIYRDWNSYQEIVLDQNKISYEEYCINKIRKHTKKKTNLEFNITNIEFPDY